jgi:hypothetical protein
MIGRSIFLFISIIILHSTAYQKPPGVKRLLKKFGTADSDLVPGEILVDIIEPDVEVTAPCKVNEAQDFGSVLAGHKKCILFAVPGAFTPT